MFLEQEQGREQRRGGIREGKRGTEENSSVENLGPQGHRSIDRFMEEDGEPPP